jgi:hypothetical protein
MSREHSSVTIDIKPAYRIFEISHGDVHLPINAAGISLASLCYSPQSNVFPKNDISLQRDGLRDM